MEHHPDSPQNPVGNHSPEPADAARRKENSDGPFVPWNTRDGVFRIPILYADNHLFVVEKPAGMLSQSDSSGDMDLLTLCRDYIKKEYNKPGEVYLGLVHRLDRAVGGVMLFARTSKAAARLSEQFRKHSVVKLYHAVVEGIPENESGERRDHLVKDEKERMAREARPTHPGAQEARLYYTILRKGKDPKGNPIAWVEVELLTGRFHQIRFQLSRMGHPILGDKKYGATFPFPAGQIALRACLLEVEHPTKKSPLILESPDPEGWPYNK